MAAVPVRNREFTPEERLWLALEWDKKQFTGRNFQMIAHLFTIHFPGKAAPASASTLSRMHTKLLNRNTTQNCRKGNSGRRKTVDTAFNCAWMEAIITFKMNNRPGDVMNPARFVGLFNHDHIILAYVSRNWYLNFPHRRNNMNLSYSSWSRLTKKLRLHPYRVRRVHKISQANKRKRLMMGTHLIQQPQV